MSGYSGTPLAKKLGFRDGYRVRIRGAPANYLQLVSPVPDNVRISTRFRKDIDILHFFTASSTDLESELPKLKYAIRQDGMIWVSWPKKSSGVPSSVTEDTVRAVALPLGLVDVKVCAIDQTWSGLKLVIRKKLRG
ncbi:MAG: DUF3052 family protein [Woeseia sp.]